MSVRRLWLIVLLALALEALPALAVAATTCQEIPSEYDTCMADGVKAQNMSALGGADFTFIQRCTEMRNSEVERLCRTAGDRQREDNAETAAFAARTPILNADMVRDHVNSIRRAGCNLNLDRNGQPLIKNGRGSVECPSSPGEWACVRPVSPSDKCHVDISEAELATYRSMPMDHGAGAPETAKTSPRQGPNPLVDFQVISVPVLSNCKTLGIRTIDANIRTYSNGRFVVAWIKDGAGADVFAKWNLGASGDTLTQIQSHLEASCAQSRATAAAENGASFKRFIQWMAEQVNKRVWLSPTNEEVQKFRPSASIGRRG